MALTNFSVFSEYMYNSATETIAQQVELFNTASRNTITLRSGSSDGDYSYDTMFAQVANMVSNRNAYGTGTFSPVALEQLQTASVKIGGRTELMEFSPSDFDWINQDPEQAGTAFGEQVAKGLLQYMLNSALAATSAALSGVAALDYDGTAAVASLNSLQSAAGLFGDRASAVAAWIMHSKSKTDIIGAAITNANDLFEFGTVRITTDAEGRPLIVTDSPALIDIDAGGAGIHHYHQLGLVTGAIMLQDNQNYRLHENSDVTAENTKYFMKAEFDFNLGIKGFTWDTVTGVKSPSDAQLATQTNWDQTATEVKDLCGVRSTTLQVIYGKA